jgi:hypothetical protein
VFEGTFATGTMYLDILYSAYNSTTFVSYSGENQTGGGGGPV